MTEAVALGPLDRVGEGVAVVEDLPAGVRAAAAGLLEVAGDHVELDLHRPLNELAQRRAYLDRTKGWDTLIGCPALPR